jgi:hypothetical protein
MSSSEEGTIVNEPDESVTVKEELASSSGWEEEELEEEDATAAAELSRGFHDHVPEAVIMAKDTANKERVAIKEEGAAVAANFTNNNVPVVIKEVIKEAFYNDGMSDLETPCPTPLGLCTTR